MKFRKIFYSKCPNCHKYGIELHGYEREVTIKCKYCHEKFKTNSASSGLYMLLYFSLCIPWLIIFNFAKPIVVISILLMIITYYLIGKFSPIYGKTTEYKYDNKHRCPWCGNKLPDFLNENTCPKCKHTVKIFSHTKTYIGLIIGFSIIFFVLFILELFLPCCIFFEMGIILLVAIYKLSIPYRIDDGTKISKQKAMIHIYPNKQSDILFPRLIIRKNKIFTLCFVRDDNTPISQIICVFLEDIKIHHRDLDLTLSYLPFGKLDNKYCSDSKFYIFLRENKIGKKLSYLSIKKTFKLIATDFMSIKKEEKNIQKVWIVGELYIKYCHLGNWGLESFLKEQSCEYMVNGFSWYVLYYIDAHMIDENAVIKILYKIALRYLSSLQKSMIKSIRNSGFYCLDEFHDFKKNAKGKVPFVIRAADGWLIGCEIVNLIDTGFDKILCAQPFGCMPNHVCGKGVYPYLQREFPKSQIVSVDYDSSGNEVNVRNRIKMLLDIDR